MGYVATHTAREVAREVPRGCPANGRKTSRVRAREVPRGRPCDYLPAGPRLLPAETPAAVRNQAPKGSPVSFSCAHVSCSVGSRYAFTTT